MMSDIREEYSLCLQDKKIHDLRGVSLSGQVMIDPMVGMSR